MLKMLEILCTLLFPILESYEMNDDSNIAEIVLRGLMTRGSRVALKAFGKEFTGAEIVAMVEATCLKLKSMGMAPGDRALVINDGDAYFLVFYLAITKMSGVVVPSPVDRDLRFGSTYLVERTNPRVIIAPSAVIEHPLLIADEIPYFIEQRLRTPDVMSETLAGLGTAAIMFTSGTSGVPKAVMVTHENLCATREKNVYFQELSSDTVELNTLPLNHSFGLGQLIATLSVGGMAILQPGLKNLKHVFRAAQEEKVNSFPTTPSGLRILTGRFGSVFQQAFSTLRTIMVNSAPLAPELSREVMLMLPATRLLVYYGLTEASRATFADFSNAESSALHTVGKPLGNTKISLIAPNNEICISGANVSPGYFVDFETPPELHDCGLLLTGDKGKIDEKGRLIILGRLSDEINVGGYKVDPLEVERIATEIKGISGACLTFVDSLDGIRATVLLMQSQEKLDEFTIRKHLQKCLEQYKLPSHLMRVEKMPYHENGKLDRILARSVAQGALS
jgi:long-chain acyl-CoA synthetase